MFKKLIIALGILSLSLMAMGQEVSITSTPPNHINVCGEAVSFQVTIVNSSTSPISNAQFTAELPSGISYVDGSATGMSPVSNINLAAPVFDLADIAAGASVNLTYQCKADCGLLDYISTQGATVLNNSLLDCSHNGASTQYSEQEPDTYNVFYPELKITVQEDEREQTPEYFTQEMYRHITITNTGTFAMDQVRLSISNEQEIDFKSLHWLKEDGSKVLLTPYSNTLNDPIYILTTFEGEDPTVLAPGESITLLDEIKVMRANPSARTDYEVGWSCGANACVGATHEAYVSSPLGIVKYQVAHNQVQRGSFVTDENSIDESCLIYDMVLKNIGEDNQVGQKWLSTIHDIGIRMQDDKFRSNVIVSIYNGSEYVAIPEALKSGMDIDFTLNKSNIDGEGGLEDLDKDGFYDDLAKNSEIRLRFKLSLLYENRIQTSGRIYLRAASLRASNMEIVKGYPIEGKYYQIDERNIEIQGDNNLGVGEFSHIINCESVTNLGANQSFIDKANSVYRLRIKLPYKGVNLNAVEITNDEGVLSLTVNNEDDLNYYVLFDQNTVLDLNASFKIDYDIDCNVAKLAEDVGKFEYKIDYLFDKGDLNSGINLLFRWFDVSNKCKVSDYFGMTLFNLERTTFGWENPNNEVSFKYSELYGEKATIKKVNKETQGIDKQVILEGDSFVVNLEGDIKQDCNTTDLIIETSYNSHINQKLFIVESIEFLHGNEIISLETNDYSIEEEITFGKTIQKIRVLKNIFLRSGESIGYNIDYGFPTDYGKYRNVSSIEDYGVVIKELNETTVSPAYKSIKLCPVNLYANRSINSSLLCIFEDYPRGLVDFDMPITNPFPNEFRALIVFDKIKVKIPNEFSLDYVNHKSMIYFQNQKLDLHTIKVTSDNEIQFLHNVSNPVIGFPTSGHREFLTVRANFLKNENFVPVAETQEYHIVSELSFRNRVDLKNYNRYHWRLGVRNIEITSIDIQESKSKSIEFPIQITNYDGTTNTFSWLAVELRDNDNGTFIEGVKDKDGKWLLGGVYYGEKVKEGRGNYFVRIPFLEQAKNTNFSVVVHSNTCNNGGIQEVDVLFNHNCGKLPLEYNLYDNDNTYYSNLNTIRDVGGLASIIRSDTLKIRYAQANMHGALSRMGAQEGLLGAAADFDLELQSTQEGLIADIDVEVELPEHVEMDANVPGRIQYQYPYGGSWQDVPMMYVRNTQKGLAIDVDGVLGGGLSGVEAPDNKVALRFSVFPQAGMDPGIPVKWTVDAFAACTDRIPIEAFQKKIALQGYHLEELDLQLEATGFEGCNTDNQVVLTLTNNGTEASISEELIMVLPVGVRFDEASGDIADFISTEITDLQGDMDDEPGDLGEMLTFRLPKGYLEPGESKTVILHTKSGGRGPSGDVLEFYAFTKMTGKVMDVDGNEHELRGTTGQVKTELETSNIFPRAYISAQVEFPVCKGTNLSLVPLSYDGSEAPEDYTYQWTKLGDESFGSTEKVLRVQADKSEYYRLKVSKGGCSTYSWRQVEVDARENPLGEIELAVDRNCDTQPMELTFMVEHQTGNQYKWYKDGIATTDDLTDFSSLTTSESGLYSVYVERDGCGTVSDERRAFPDFPEELSFYMSSDELEVGEKLRVQIARRDYNRHYRYLWDWGDGETSYTRLKKKSHKYQRAGTYNVGLRLLHTASCDDKLTTQQVQVNRSLCETVIPMGRSGETIFEKATGRLIYKFDECGDDVNLSCVWGQSAYNSLDSAVSASATTYAHEWDYDFDAYNTTNINTLDFNDYDLGKKGKWRPKASYQYKSNLSHYDLNRNSGTFRMELFNWQQEESNNRERWVKTSELEKYDPHGNPLQESDAMGISSAVRYGRYDYMPCITAKNAEYDGIWFESFENMQGDMFEEVLYEPERMQVNNKFVHSGKQSLEIFPEKYFLSKRFELTEQILSEGLLVRFWLKPKQNLKAEEIKAHLHTYFGNESMFNENSSLDILAHNGDWYLVEYHLKEFGELAEGSTFMFGLKPEEGYHFYIDDMRAAPAKAEVGCYVYDLSTLQVITIFDDQHFGLYYQYNEEGKLIRKKIETEEGIRTIMETQYNRPKQENITEH
jgi:uncharacterized repeat protein (TIGR01451 family)